MYMYDPKHMYDPKQGSYTKGEYDKLKAKLKAKGLTIELIKEHAKIGFDLNLLALIAEIEIDPEKFEQKLKGDSCG